MLLYHNLCKSLKAQITLLWFGLHYLSPHLSVHFCKARAAFYFSLCSRARTIWDNKWTLMKACVNEWMHTCMHACVNNNEKKFHHFHSSLAHCNPEWRFSDLFLGSGKNKHHWNVLHNACPPHCHQKQHLVCPLPTTRDKGNHIIFPLKLFLGCSIRTDQKLRKLSSKTGSACCSHVQKALQPIGTRRSSEWTHNSRKVQTVFLHLDIQC